MPKAVDAVVIDADSPIGDTIIGATSSATRSRAVDAVMVDDDTPEGRITVRKPCKNGCGWTAYKTYETCCKQCRGTYGPHSRDCALKSKRTLRHRKHEMRGNGTAAAEDEKQRNVFDEVKKRELNGRSTMELMKVLVESDWLIGIEALEGNIYRAFAFGSFPEPVFASPRTAEWDTIWSGIAVNGKVLGAATIWLVQILGPVLIIWHYVQRYMDEDSAVPKIWEYPGAKLLGLALVIMFNVNAYFEVKQEAITYAKIDVIYTHFGPKHDGSNRFGPSSGQILLLGECTNCYVFVTSCICSCLLMSYADNPQDLLFDALAILFLYNLDDISSGLTFVTDDDWPGHRLSWLYDQVSNDKVDQRDRPKYLYWVTESTILALSWILPILFLYSAF